MLIEVLEGPPLLRLAGPDRVGTPQVPKAAKANGRKYRSPPALKAPRWSSRIRMRPRPEQWRRGQAATRFRAAARGRLQVHVRQPGDCRAGASWTRLVSFPTSPTSLRCRRPSPSAMADGLCHGGRAAGCRPASQRGGAGQRRRHALPGPPRACTADRVSPASPGSGTTRWTPRWASTRGHRPAGDQVGDTGHPPASLLRVIRRAIKIASTPPMGGLRACRWTSWTTSPPSRPCRPQCR